MNLTSSPPVIPPMQKLQCVVQTYAWGKLGLESSVAQLMEAGDASFKADRGTPYAELWMGTHANGPSRVLREGTHESPLLSEWLQQLHRGGSEEPRDLPYLFKVLSVRKALSIQAHPDVKLAAKLHAKFPEMYKDANHKPEMIIAITRFEALCQFRDIHEIVTHLETVPEFRALVDPEITQQLRAQQNEASLRVFFRSFIYAEPDTIVAQLQTLRARLETSSDLTAMEKMVLRLDDEHPGDIGCFCPFLLNYVALEPGEAMFLHANEPHAYLSGDCIECMACSDNVVRAGLTPKFMDKETLHSMLTYHTGKPHVYKGESQGAGVARLYSSPAPEFEVETVELKPDQRYKLPARKGDSIVLVTCGSGSRMDHPNGTADGQLISKGEVYFLSKEEVLEIRGGSDEGITIFRASPNESLSSS